MDQNLLHVAPDLILDWYISPTEYTYAFPVVLNDSLGNQPSAGPEMTPELEDVPPDCAIAHHRR
jgi:hypothetical protein